MIISIYNKTYALEDFDYNTCWLYAWLCKNYCIGRSDIKFLIRYYVRLNVSGYLTVVWTVWSRILLLVKILSMSHENLSDDIMTKIQIKWTIRNFRADMLEGLSKNKINVSHV